MNVVMLIGRLTRDPELRYIPSSGKAVTSFAIAVDRPFTGKDGQKQTDFFNIQAWDKQAENCANFLAKGRLVAVRGSIQNRTYETPNGEKKYITEIKAENVQFLEFKDKNTPNQQQDFVSPTSSPDGQYYTLEDNADVPF